MTETVSDFLRVGEIIKPHGIEGELVVESLTDFPEERFKPGTQLTAFHPDDDREQLTVEGYRWHQDRVLLQVREVDDRNRAEDLRGCWLGVPTEDELEESEGFFGHELIGLDVYTSNGESRGTITDVFPDEMNPLALIELEEGTMEFPLSPGLVEDVELEENRIVLKFPTGWKKLLNPSSE